MCFMFPQTDGMGEILLRGSNFYPEPRIFALRYRFCVIVYGDRKQRLLHRKMD